MWLAALAIGASGCGAEAQVEPPQPLPGEPVVQYPVVLWDAGVEGETILMVHVTEEGTVDSAYVDQSSGLEEFDSAAVQGGRQMRFTPGHQGGERRAMWTRLPVRFRRTSPGSSSVETPGSRG
jgi:TonB family protein